LVPESCRDFLPAHDGVTRMNESWLPLVYRDCDKYAMSVARFAGRRFATHIKSAALDEEWQDIFAAPTPLLPRSFSGLAFPE